MGLRLFFSVLLFSSSLIQAQDTDFNFEDIVLRGTGCPAGTTSVVPAPDDKTVSILFDRFSASVPQNDGQNDNDEASEEGSGGEGKLNPRLSQKVCNIVIKARIPVGHKVDGASIFFDYRGATAVEKGAVAAFRSNLIEVQGPVAQGRREKFPLFVKRWATPQMEDWQISNTVNIDANSGCAARHDRRVRFVLRNVLVARIGPHINPQNTSALISLDTADIKGNLKLKVNYSPCSGRPRLGRPIR